MLVEDFREVRPCRLCDAEGARTLFSYEADHYAHDRYETSSWDGRESVELSIVECTRCGFRYASPSFKEEALGRVYPPDLIEASSPAIAAPAFDVHHKKSNSLLRIVARHADRGATLLDVGARYGALPFVAQERYGFEAHGLEYNAASVAKGRRRFPHLTEGGLEAIDSVLEARGWPAVDVFVLDDVVEHLVEPVRDLEILAAHQRPGGLMALRQMDSDGLGAKLFGRHWYYYQPAAHISYFTEATLGRLLDRVGYRVVAVERPPLMKNVAKTAALLAPTRGRVLLRRLKGRLKGTKPIYNEHRWKMHDDMFTVIAARR